MPSIKNPWQYGIPAIVSKMALDVTESLSLAVAKRAVGKRAGSGASVADYDIKVTTDYMPTGTSRKLTITLSIEGSE